MHRVVIGGTGGTGIGAAETILRKNPNAHVTMIGKDSPAGLMENGQFQSVVAKYGTAELCAKLHIKPETADGRFEIHDGFLVDAPTRVAGGYDASARPASSDTKPLPAGAAQGDTYIAALGRFDDLPPPIAALANAAERAGGHVTKTALVGEKQFVGYEITIKQPGRPDVHFDVTGAASRYADKSKTDAGSRELMHEANDNDAPPESGNFAGGYAASANQQLDIECTEAHVDIEFGKRRRNYEVRGVYAGSSVEARRGWSVTESREFCTLVRSVVGRIHRSPTRYF